MSHFLRLFQTLTAIVDLFYTLVHTWCREGSCFYSHTILCISASWNHTYFAHYDRLREWKQVCEGRSHKRMYVLMCEKGWISICFSNIHIYTCSFKSINQTIHPKPPASSSFYPASCQLSGKLFLMAAQWWCCGGQQKVLAGQATKWDLGEKSPLFPWTPQKVTQTCRGAAEQTMPKWTRRRLHP